MSSPKRKLTYQETRKATLTAQALYEAEYNDAYVLDALIRTGLTKEQGEWVLLSAELKNLKHRRRVNGIIALVMGIGWLIIAVLFFSTQDVPESTAAIRYERRIPENYWHIIAVIFLGALGNFAYSAWRVKKLEGSFPEEPPLCA